LFEHRFAMIERGAYGSGIHDTVSWRIFLRGEGLEPGDAEPCVLARRREPKVGRVDSIQLAPQDPARWISSFTRAFTIFLSKTDQQA